VSRPRGDDTVTAVDEGPIGRTVALAR
jgi:hypothetical protein